MASRGQRGGPTIRPVNEKPKKDIVGVIAYVRDKDGRLVKIYWVHSRLRKNTHVKANRELSIYWRRQLERLFKNW